jgi:energy-coupling factor transport system permease protein
MSSDKFLWLFGRVTPALALVISMTLRLVPRYTAQAGRIAAARAGLGHGLGTGSVVARAQGGLTILSTMTTWALENAVDTADSMLARGYGSTRRTSYSNYRLSRRDGWVLAFLLVAAGGCVALAATDAVSLAYFPTFAAEGDSWASALLAVIWAAFCFLPLSLAIWEDARWRWLRQQ